MRVIALGADHGGFELKQTIATHLASRGCQVADCGTFSTEAVDYPRIAHAVARKVASGEAVAGIVIDGAGIGSAMAANKVPGVRAALCYDLSSARNSREHNNANVLTLGARLIGPGLATQIVDAFLDTECTAERHLRRVAMIEDLAEEAPTASAGVPSTTAVNVSCGCSNGDSGSTTIGAAQSAAEAALSELSEHDLQRVADRIAGMLAAGGAAGEAGCGFCRPCRDVSPQQMRDFIQLGADRLVHRGKGDAVPKDVARFIDHTLLRPDATYAQIDKLCAEAAEFGFASVCINPIHVKRCARALRGTEVTVCTVVGFPLGATTAETKALEARRAIRDGAKEIDMVINVGALKSGDDAAVQADIRAVVEACLDGSALCKVIIETALLTDDEKTRACQAAVRARADFVKTSTGFSTGGATAEDVALMSAAVTGAKLGVKASGGIRSYEEAQQMIRAGATRLGVSAGVRIVKEAQGVTVSGEGGDKY